jgi:hypothetical protein
MTSIKNNLQRANAARIIFYLLLTISIISLYSHYLQYELLLGGKNGTGISQEAAAANDYRQQFISSLNVFLLLASTVIFLMWVYRAYDNLYKLKPDNLSSTPGWAVGYWFVPIISLYKPYVTMKEIWDETQAYVLPEEKKQDIKKGYLIGIWWILYLFSIVSSYVVLFAFGGDNSIDGLMNMTIALMCSNVFIIIVKIITLIMINRIVLYEKALYEFVKSKEDHQPSGAGPA